MTAPIFEPTPERADASLQFADQQLFRRPAPLPKDGLTDYAWIWHASGSANCTTDVAYDITSDGGAGANPYDQAFISGVNAPGFTYSLANGWIQYAEPGLYFVHAECQVRSDITGKSMAPIIQTGTSGGFAGQNMDVNLMPGDGTAAALEDCRVAVHTWTYDDRDAIGRPTLNGNRFRFLFWQNTGIDASIEAVVLFVARLTSVVTGTFDPP